MKGLAYNRFFREILTKREVDNKWNMNEKI